MTKFLGFSRKVDAPQRRRFAFVFVCRAGAREIESALLAASLHRNLRCRNELIACMPGGARPSPEVHAFVKSMGARFVHVDGPLGPDSEAGIKMACLALSTTADKIVYLDNDMLCTGPFDDEARFMMPLNLKPADLQTFTSSDETWRHAYRAALLDPPDRRLRATVSDEEGYPYFNSGFIAVNKGADLATAWQYCAKHLAADATLPRYDDLADQPALAAAVHLMSCAYDVLNERYNFPAHLRAIKDADLPLFCRYREPPVIRREPQLTRLVQDLAAAHPELARILARDAAWRALLKPYAVAPAPRSWRFRKKAVLEGPDILITGIPRSGAGVLAEWMRQYDNCVVLDEPAEIVASLHDDFVPTGVGTFLRDARRAVLDGVGPPDQPHVRAADFVVGVKVTEAALPRLDVLLDKVVPGARCVACVRHPLDTIASWQDREPNVPDRLAPADDQAKLARIARMTDPTERRAWIWRYLAEIILRNQERLMLACYESLVANPQAVLDELFHGAQPGRPRTPIAASAPKSSRERLSARDREVILSICSEPARSLGINVA